MGAGARGGGVTTARRAGAGVTTRNPAGAGAEDAAADTGPGDAEPTYAALRALRAPLARVMQ